MVIAIIVIMIVANHREAKSLEAEAEYYEIMKVADAPERARVLEGFAKKHEGKNIAMLADMWLGAYYDEKGESEKSVSFYEKVVQSSGNKPIHYIAIDALAPVYAGLGRAGDAAELYIKAAGEKANPEPYYSRYRAASMYEISGDPNRAKEIYTSLIKDEKSPSVVKLKAEEQVLWLETSKD